jgi:hypothetical protein
MLEKVFSPALSRLRELPGVVTTTAQGQADLPRYYPWEAAIGQAVMARLKR